MINLLKYTICLSFVLLLSGCYFHIPSAKKEAHYINSSISDENERNLKFNEDKLFCEIYAWEKVPNTFSSSGNSNNSGTFEIRNANTGVVHQGQYKDSNSGDIENFAYISQVNKAPRAKYFEYCMMQKGWIKEKE